MFFGQKTRILPLQNLRVEIEMQAMSSVVGGSLKVLVLQRIVRGHELLYHIL